MRNAIDYSLQPKDLFLNPVQDKGLSFVEEPGFFWRRRESAVIEGFAASAHEVMNKRISSYIQTVKKHRLFSSAVEFNTVPVLLEDASFRKSYIAANGKCLLTGTAGTRLLNRYCWENEGTLEAGEQDLVDYFQASQDANTTFSVLRVSHPIPDDTPFAVTCRNTFNYYHFVTESLPQLCLLDDLNLTGPVSLHFPNKDEKTRRFTHDFVQALFPELNGRVSFERVPKDYDQVLTAFNFCNTYYQFPSSVIPSVDELAPSATYWKGRSATRSSQAILTANSVDRSLIRLRERALRAIEGKDFSYLPKRFWIARAAGQSRDRSMRGEEELFDLLKEFGFVRVAFENLNPLEQIAIMAQAEMMISYHGAGFANMIFAHEQAFVVELGTLQTAVHRWGDFWQSANTSRCRYISFFADYNKADPLVDPAFATEGIVPVSLSENSIWQIMEFVTGVLGAPPVVESEEALHRLILQLQKIGADRQALLVLERNASLVRVSSRLCLFQADVHKKLGQFNAELLSIVAADRADPSNWTTLARMIWCAKRLENTDVIQWAIGRIARDFPSRLEPMIAERPWLARLIPA